MLDVKLIFFLTNEEKQFHIIFVFPVEISFPLLWARVPIFLALVMEIKVAIMTMNCVLGKLGACGSVQLWNRGQTIKTKTASTFD
jgi:hypothetical protein